METLEPYQATAGRRYQVRYRKPDGTQTKKRGFRTKRDAELFLALWKFLRLAGSSSTLQLREP